MLRFSQLPRFCAMEMMQADFLLILFLINLKLSREKSREDLSSQL